MASVSVAVHIPPRIVEKNDGPECPLDSESRMVPLLDNEIVSVCGDRRGSRLMGIESLDLLNSYEVLQMEMREMKAAVDVLGRWYRQCQCTTTEPHASPISRISKPLPPSASRFMSVEQLRLQCARVGRTNSSSLATANPGSFFVTNFQAHARGFIIRKLVDTFWVHYIAASRIQAAWRGYKTRNYMRRIQRRSQGVDARFTQLEQRMDEEEARMEGVVDEIRLLRQLEDRVQEEVDLRKGYEKKIESMAAEIKELRHLEQRVREESELRKGLQDRLEEAQADMIASRALKQRVLEEAELRRGLEKRLDEAVEEMQVSRQLKQRIAEEAELRKGLERKLQEALEDLSTSKQLEQRMQEEAESRRVLEQRLDQALVEMRAAKELEQRVATEEKMRKGLEKKLEEAFAEIHTLKTNTAIKPSTAISSQVSSMRASVGPAQGSVNSPVRATRAHGPVNTAPVATRPIGRREEKLAALGRVNSP
ncbi:hypothetical protein BC937DRAFT_94518 [Endogone sp. FLAS-F59071]|nr:hypothetical protein BC937DRAFT_94518 [Endogone sp. FLAS-F59071]|eukprot:RUS13978.1 hypothetical protein BC937DRAFT_94518 [Endogone sp. FLAS-F59071]